MRGGSALTPAAAGDHSARPAQITAALVARPVIIMRTLVNPFARIQPPLSNRATFSNKQHDCRGAARGFSESTGERSPIKAVSPSGASNTRKFSVMSAFERLGEAIAWPGHVSAALLGSFNL
jgi:hypothetical protein